MAGLQFWIHSAFPLHKFLFFWNTITGNSDFRLLLILLYCQHFASTSCHQDPTFYTKFSVLNGIVTEILHGSCVHDTKINTVGMYCSLPSISNIFFHEKLHDIAIISQNLCPISNPLTAFAACRHYSSEHCCKTSAYDKMGQKEIQENSVPLGHRQGVAIHKTKAPQKTSCIYNCLFY